MIITDKIFSAHGGDIGKSSAEQRAIAYGITEELVAVHIGAPLQPTRVSGTFTIPLDNGSIMLAHGYVTAIHSIGYVALNKNYNISNAYLSAYNNEWGIVPYSSVYEYLNYCPDNRQLIIDYTCGLPTGTFSNVMYMQGMVAIAQNVLYEISDPSSLESGPGDVGVKGFANNGYRENRAGLVNVIFGNSAAIQKARKYLAHLRRVKGAVI